MAAWGVAVIGTQVALAYLRASNGRGVVVGHTGYCGALPVRDVRISLVEGEFIVGGMRLAEDAVREAARGATWEIIR